MGNIRKPGKVKLIASLIFKDDDCLARVEKKMARKYGPVDFVSDVMPFDWTKYYDDEFGAPLKRKLISFEKLRDVEGLENVKRWTNALELAMAKGGKRRVNIDPGYLNDAKMVLFTTKDYSHRIYIKRGIFAEPTLCYRNGRFNPWPWTYRDYASDTMVSYFNGVRGKYMQEIKASCGGRKG
ncbi:MAG TPA: DUF4416 family protein [Candidatus Omnitrophota bacterium]|nr:DUF4416 family protein [Candidatus Omnitrophota bacterium]HPS20828.1 DUF4416 family protein [Candidatus Omnitrophota bacterium]